MKWSAAGLVVGVMLVMTVSVYAAKGDKVIEKGRTVTFDYTLTVDGQIVDSSQREGRQPLQYTHGEGKIIPGLSRQLEGLQVGDEKNIVIAPEEAYGAVDPRAFKEVSKSQLPQNTPLTVGTQLQAKSEEGQILIVTVSELKKESVILNFNHPLAGKELHFKVKILAVQ